MSNIAIREKALALRKQRKSYSQIKSELGVPKSTLSYWLRDYPLSREEINKLGGKNEARIEKFKNTMRGKRQVRLDVIYAKEKNHILPLSNKDALILGLALYWGEGSKADWYKIALANTDPQVLKFFIYWLTKILHVKKSALRVYLHLYADMNIKNELNYWSKTLKIPASKFVKPYIKMAKSTRINHKGGFGHGTCTIMYNNVELKQKIMMQLKLLTSFIP
ncbi:MAG: helix-turn-helix domain containing protein [Patescibacteria group bacterium]|nr:helix-turn-helix domain containing protein [Patescibacteria group bacterium]